MTERIFIGIFIAFQLAVQIQEIKEHQPDLKALHQTIT